MSSGARPRPEERSAVDPQGRPPRSQPRRDAAAARQRDRRLKLWTRHSPLGAPIACSPQIGDEPNYLRVFGIVGPSRPRRCPRPAFPRAIGLDANLASRTPALLVVTDKGTSLCQHGHPARSRGSTSADDASAGVDSATARAMTRRCQSSITTSSAGSSIRDSRQARRPVSPLAAGIVAASMARRCQNPSQTPRGLFPRECCLPACRARHGEAGELVL